MLEDAGPTVVVELRRLGIGGGAIIGEFFDCVPPGLGLLLNCNLY